MQVAQLFDIGAQGPIHGPIPGDENSSRFRIYKCGHG